MSRAIIALQDAVNRQFPSADTSPPCESLKTTDLCDGESFSSSGCFHSTPFACSRWR
uniref:Uncharacterized protein n=1 Tax=Rhizophora mucronata TaxID=61149 RepID=A0A2P2Q0I3_RHIMU